MDIRLEIPATGQVIEGEDEIEEFLESLREKEESDNE